MIDGQRSRRGQITLRSCNKSVSRWLFALAEMQFKIQRQGRRLPELLPLPVGVLLSAVMVGKMADGGAVWYSRRSF